MAFPAPNGEKKLMRMDSFDSSSDGGGNGESTLQKIKRSKSLLSIASLAKKQTSHVHAMKHYNYGTVHQPLGVRLERLEKARRRNKMLFCLWSLIGLASACIENEVRWVLPPHSEENITFIDFLQLATLATSFIALFYLRQFSIAHMRLRDPDNDDTGLKAYLRAGTFATFLVDFLSLLPQPIPFFNFEVSIQDTTGVAYDTYLSNDILLLLMFVRLCRVPHLAVSWSRYNTNATRAIGKLNSCDVNTTLLLKHSLNHDFGFVLSAAVSLIIVFSYMMMIAERRHAASDLRLFSNCVWLVVVTMTTVGYGDVYPRTLTGRTVAVFCSSSALIVFALILNGVMERLALTRLESNVLIVSDRIKRRKDTKQAAARVIQRMFQISRDVSKEIQMQQADPESPGGLLSKNMVLKAGLHTDVKMLRHIRHFRRARRSEKQNFFQDSDDSFFLVETWHNSKSLLRMVEEVEEQAEKAASAADILNRKTPDSNPTTPALAPSSMNFPLSSSSSGGMGVGGGGGFGGGSFGGGGFGGGKMAPYLSAIQTNTSLRPLENRVMSIERQLVGMNVLLERCVKAIERLPTASSTKAAAEQK